ncbi:MAG: hypothetical protein A2Y10_18195 [Planctomycetes bacterium GWF2_41_51]|nr:MAG: hypothetical protein A2Y10_18195 [Planctomycetes bacterium GWF2_41_51]HBG27518.1 hypothetical protein [Phycisphaerales bacterium]
MKEKIFGILFFAFAVAAADAGPYTESGVNGYIDDDYKHANPLNDSDAIVNPIFRGWATGFTNYLPSDSQWSGPWDDPSKALGLVTGLYTDVVSLGDLENAEIAAGVNPGQITLVFGDPQNSSDANHIRNVKGYDFAVFENGGNGVFSEIAFVEVSSDGMNFARFPAVSLTDTLPGPYGSIDVTNVYNLAGKHPNFSGVCTGTPFDLSELANDPNVVNNLVNVNNICFVRIVDIPGSGDFYDVFNHSIYDAWLTWGSGGFDLEAVGTLKEQQFSADINLDGIVDGEDFALFMSAWLSCFGDENWIGRCDLAEPKDDTINFQDYAVFVSQWLKIENWRD